MTVVQIACRRQPYPCFRFGSASACYASAVRLGRDRQGPNVRTGSGRFTFDLVPGWAKIPPNIATGWIGGVVTDRRGRVYCFGRGTHPMLVFDREGSLVDHWGDSFVSHAHGAFIDDDEQLWLTDRFAQVVWVCDTAGQVLRKIGLLHIRSTDDDYHMRGDPPPGEPPRFDGFNHPTNTHLAADGTLFVADGYRAAKCHRFSAAGVIETSWGSPGAEPGQFDLPHGIWVTRDDRVLVADRENSRVQVFNRDGEFQEEWTDLHRPTDLFVDENANAVYISELSGRVSVLDLEGTLITRLGEAGTGPGQFAAPHDVWLDDQGALYVCEVQRSNRLHKFVPV